jgi:hypothetical protein
LPLGVKLLDKTKRESLATTNCFHEGQPMSHLEW